MQAKEDFQAAKQDFQAVRKEAKGLWSDVQRALSESDVDGAAQDNAGLEWEGLKKGVSKAAKDVLGEVSTTKYTRRRRFSAASATSSGTPTLELVF